MKIKCPSCGKKHEINLGALVAQQRWENATPEQRKIQNERMNLGRRNKAKLKLSPDK